MATITQKSNHFKQVIEALAVLGSMVAIYFVYMELKKRKDNFLESATN